MCGPEDDPTQEEQPNKEDWDDYQDWLREQEEQSKDDYKAYYP